MESKFVLAAEDDPFVQETLKTLLKILKVSHQVTGNGEECFNAYKAGAGKVTLILMDIQMPVMNGFAATKAIREFERTKGYAKCQIVGLSGDDDAATVKEAQTSGMDSILKKPIKKDMLAKLI